MVEIYNKIGYEEWDKKAFVIPSEYQLKETSYLHEAINVFYAAGGYDFFQVINPEKYAMGWLDFIGSLYSEIEAGNYKSDGKQHSIPLSEEERGFLVEQGVPDIFTNDII